MRRRRFFFFLAFHFSTFRLLARSHPLNFSAGGAFGDDARHFFKPLFLRVRDCLHFGSKMRLSATNARASRAAACSASASSPSPQASIVFCRRRGPSTIPLSRRPASYRAPLVTGVMPLSSSTSTKGATRREIRAAAAPETEPSEPPRRLELVGALPADASLDERISSGEFTDSGSTKERASRPVRKFLAQDPFGPGEIMRGEEILEVEDAREGLAS